MGKATNTFSPEVREHAIRLVLDQEHLHQDPSCRAPITSIASKIVCTAQTLDEWVKKAEVDAGPPWRRGDCGNSDGTRLEPGAKPLPCCFASSGVPLPRLIRWSPRRLGC
jgi:transposase-like protein